MRPPKQINRWSRRLHRWGVLPAALPLLLVVATGLLLQVKKQVAWVQPQEMRGAGGEPTITMGELLERASGVPEAQIQGWEDVDRIDVRPGRGIAKVRARNFWEVQIDTATGEVLGSARRRSDFIETLHDGSFFGEGAKLGIFLPAGVVLLGLWVTGLYLWVLPRWAKAARRRRLGL